MWAKPPPGGACRSSRSRRLRLDEHLRRGEARAAARRALAWLREFLFVEGEAAGAAARRDDGHCVTCRARRTDGVAKVFLHLPAPEPPLPGEPRGRSRLGRQQRNQFLPKRHEPIRSRSSATRKRIDSGNIGSESVCAVVP